MADRTLDARLESLLREALHAEAASVPVQVSVDQIMERAKVRNGTPVSWRRRGFVLGAPEGSLRRLSAVVAAGAAAAVIVVAGAVLMRTLPNQPGAGGPEPTPSPTRTASSAPVTGTLAAGQTDVIIRQVAALNSRDVESFVDLFAAEGAFNPRGTFENTSSLFANNLPIADQHLLEPFMAINDAWGFEAEVVACDQLSSVEYASRYTVHSDNVEVFAHCAVKSRWPTLSLEIGEWWNYEFRGSDIVWWDQTVRDATPADRTLGLGLDGLLEWEKWLESNRSDAASRLLNPREYPVTVPCGDGVVFADATHATTAPPQPPCEWSSEGVGVDRIASDRNGRAEQDWAVDGQRFWPGGLIPYDPANAAAIEAFVSEFLAGQEQL